MDVEVVKTFRFEAAHHLPCSPQGHKCRRMHGHSYRVDVHVCGGVDPSTGWVIDFGQISSLVEPLLATLDHSCLNEIPGLDNPTSEHIAKYIFDGLCSRLPGLSAVSVWESETSRCVYRG